VRVGRVLTAEEEGAQIMDLKEHWDQVRMGGVCCKVTCSDMTLPCHQRHRWVVLPMHV
jgi:hypothetical protein